MKKNVLIIGSGGREHALGWKLKQSPKVGKIYFAPGNAGTGITGINTDINVLDFQSLTKFAKTHDIYLTVAGPDEALAAGIVDEFRREKLKIFGPIKEASQIEFSKAFAKQLMRDEGIPTAKFEKFTDPIKAKKYVQELYKKCHAEFISASSKILKPVQNDKKNLYFEAIKNGFLLVIKASGLALGKGVIIAKTLDEALKTIDELMVKKKFGKAGEEIIIEEFLEGHEVSIHAFCDGKTVSIFPPARDHKQIYENNCGPNTGGMGTISPVPGLGNFFLEQFEELIIIPILNGMRKQGITFTGCLFAGLMLTENGPKVLEFNARFGDPETESYMRILDSDIFDILKACAEGTLADLNIKWKKQSACCIVLVAEGYPGNYSKGEIIYGLDKVDGKKEIAVFHFGTKNENGKIVTNGGRVLGITATGQRLNEALRKAYSVIGKNGIHFKGMQYRQDIGRV